MIASPMVHTSGYLPAVGPAPLRFQMAASMAAPAPLPPLQMSTPLPPLSEEASAETNLLHDFPQPPGEFGPQPDSIPGAEDGTASTNSTDTVRMTPQMLLQFFQQQQPQKPGNGPSTSVLVPLNFTPPEPVLRPSSSATYNSR